MIDYLKQIIDDLNDGIITVETAQNRLDFDMKKRDKPVKLIEYSEQPRDPLDIVVSDERTEELIDAVAYLKEVLDDSDWTVLCGISNGITYDAIAKDIGTSVSNVAYRIAHIKRYADGIQRLLRKDPPLYYATTPKVKVAYPMDSAKAMKPCGIPKYLRNAGVPSLCTLCEHCHAKDL